jgi:septal ring factor EnvC (AmiA/AmiB activator)
MSGTCRLTRAVSLLVAPVVLAIVLWAGLSLAPARAASISSLRQQVARQARRERALASSTARLGRLIAQLGTQVAILSHREVATQAQLDAWLARLARTRAQLQAARARLAALRVHLAATRSTLAAQLMAQYTSPQVDLVTVVLTSTSFSQLVDRAEFQHRVARANAHVVDAVRLARDATQRQAAQLAALEVRQRYATIAVRSQRDALAAMRSARQAREASLRRARAAQMAALDRTIRGRRRAQRALNRLEAQQATSFSGPGPGGPWAIPWPIVLCESGGQNLPPNGATASGYYQMTDATWRGLGGRTQHAYQAPKSVQDRLAAKLWAGGAGASNWVCSAMVGR